MKPSVIFLPSRMVSLESVIWTIRAIAPSSRLRVIQSSWPSGPATNPSTVICTCSLSFRIAIKECPGGWSTYASNQLLRNRHGGTRERRLAEVLDHHDIARDLVHSYEENPLPIRRDIKAIGGHRISEIQRRDRLHAFGRHVEELDQSRRG